MEIVKREVKLCLGCMEEHEVLTVKVRERNIFRGKVIEYDAVYDYCDDSDMYTASEDMIKTNDVAFKDAYRRACNLLTSDEICNIRTKYGISQADLAKLLGLGAKTITRYESSQVQDAANDAMLRKLDSDPEWFLYLLKASQDKFTKHAYQKYYRNAMEIYAKNADDYRRKAIAAQYAGFSELDDCCGNTSLNLDKTVEAINFFDNSPAVSVLYKVKLMKLLWYADNLSYKRYGKSITGLAYKALPMGAVPVGHDLIVDLNGVRYEEVDYPNGIGIRFLPNSGFVPKHLNEEDISVLKTVAERFGGFSTEDIINTMHKERAYKETTPCDIIRYRYAKDLSID